MPPQVKDKMQSQTKNSDSTYQVKARHQQDNMVKQEEYYALSFSHAIEIADALGTCYRDVQILNEQTGELIYNMYLSLELWEMINE